MSGWSPPFGRRLCEVTRNLASGGYRIFSALDPAGPAARRGPVLHARRGRGLGRGGGPPVPGARLLGRRRRAARAAASGSTSWCRPSAPGPRRLARARAGRGAVDPRTARDGRSRRPAELAEGAAGAILVGGGIGVAPLAIWRRQLLAAGVPGAGPARLPRSAHNSGGLELFDCSEIRLASEDGHTGHRGYVTDLLARAARGRRRRQRRRLRLRAAGDARGGPDAVRGSRRRLRAGAWRRRWPAASAPASAARSRSAPSGGYMRLCVDGPVVRGDEIETALVPGSGH